MSANPEGVEMKDEVQRSVVTDTPQEDAATHPRQEAADCCVICLDAIGDPCELIPCGHASFDHRCATSWLRCRPSCPLCQARVTGVRRGGPDAPSRPVPKVGKMTSRECRANNDRIRREMMPAAAIQTRLEVYLHRLFSLHVGSSWLSRYREITPQLFCSDQNLVSRARMFLRRELRVFSFLPLPVRNTGPLSSSSSSSSSSAPRRVDNPEFMLEYIIAILKSVDIMGSAGTARDMLADFIGRDHARLLLHELRSWLRSPFSRLVEWDCAVQYDRRSSLAPSSLHAHRRRRAGVGGTARGVGHFGDPRGDFYRPGTRARRRDQNRGRESNEINRNGAASSSRAN